MKKWLIVSSVVAALLVVSYAGAQLMVNTVVLVDVKDRGTAAHAFRTPQVKWWNFKGGAAVNTTTKTMEIGTYWADQNPDLGTVESPKGVRIGSTATRPTCNATHRGQVWTSESAATGDAGVADVTYQCCKAANGTYAWATGVCS